ncbi:MAG: hypothetical protein AB1758_14905, partial [Candidatus Eremiobacterota bacterium]
QQTLPGLTIQNNLNPPNVPGETLVPVFSPVVMRVEGGSGADTTLSGSVTGACSVSTVLQSAPGTVSSISAQNFGQ